MNTDKLFRKYLDGELKGEEEKQVLHMIADNEELRDMLRFERSLYQSIGEEVDPDSFTVPAGFTDRVMSGIAVEQTEESRNTVPVLERLRGFADTLITPREFRFRPAFALVSVVVLALLVAIPYLGNESSEMVAESAVERSTELVADHGSEVWMRFVYFDEEAESIAVAGDFSDWEEIELTREIVDNRQVWTGLIPVTRGEHRYMFVKNGSEWVTDPLAEIQREDGFGNKNAVLFL